MELAADPDLHRLEIFKRHMGQHSPDLIYLLGCIATNLKHCGGGGVTWGLVLLR